MKLRSVLFASIFGFGLALAAGQAQAVLVSGTGEGSFGGVTNCSNPSNSCGIGNGGNGTNTVLSWGSQNSSTNLVNPSTLTAVDVNWSVNTFANDVVIAQLNWFNEDTKESKTDKSYNVNWNLTVAFTSPNGSVDNSINNLLILSRFDDDHDEDRDDYIEGLNAVLANIVNDIALTNVTIGDLKFSVGNQSQGCSSSFSSSDGNGRWKLEDDGCSASLYITADFTGTQPPSSVPEPATLALLGMGLLGLGAVRRRKAA